MYTCVGANHYLENGLISKKVEARSRNSKVSPFVSDEIADVKVRFWVKIRMWIEKQKELCKHSYLFNSKKIPCLSFVIYSVYRIKLPIKCQFCPHIKTIQLICYANQLTGFYKRVTLTFNGLMGKKLYKS